ncbi:glycosyltransferase family 4 protein [Acholeplasma equifetale]|uniref:glycosyltransferase family 4 protein n=1 Tax=Acholeplasma equifetale TaxID=264634 RepID=UPI00138AF251|nr:glycosyltransferase family 4 protein [Acholeplasma equifetale]
MKVLYIVSTLERCGPNNVLYNIIKHAKFEYLIMTLSKEKDNSMIGDFQILNSKVHCLDSDDFFAKKVVVDKVINVIREENIDIIHTHGIRSDILGYKISKKTSVKHISTIHNYPYFDYPILYGKLKGFILSRIHIHYIKRIDKPIACSKFISDTFNEKYGKKIDYIQNGVDESKFFPLSDNIKKIKREKHNFSPNDVIFISTNMLIKRKRPLELIETFIQTFEKSHEKPTLLLLGDGNLKDLIIKKIGKSEMIKYIGRVSNVIEYLQIADVFVSNSIAEGLPMAALEALSCGLFLNLSSIPSHKEIFDEINTDIILFDDENISEVLKKSYSKVKTKRVKKHHHNNVFLSSIMSDKYQEVYKSEMIK